MFAAVVWLPLCGVAGLMVTPWSAYAFVALLLSVLIVILDALFSVHGFDGFTISLPEIVRLTRDRVGSIEVRVVREKREHATIHLGMPFPPAFLTDVDVLEVDLDDALVSGSVKWKVTPIERGRFALSEVFAERLSRIGFWHLRQRFPQQCEVRVYPNLMEDQRHVAAIFLNRGALGIHAQRFVGKGREFEKLREYIPGDAIEDIHWKATAKRGKPVSKVYQVERTQEVYVVMDSGRLSARTVEILGKTVTEDGDRTRTTFVDRFVAVSLLLQRVAERQADRFGLVVFDDTIRRFIRASSGKSHFGVCRDVLYTLEPRMVNPDYYELCSFLRTRIAKRALLIFLANLDDPVLAEQFLHGINLIARKHVVAVHLFLPRHIMPLFSDDRVTHLEDIYRALAGHIQWRDLFELDRALRRKGIWMNVLDNETMSAQVIGQYLSLRQRQLL